MKNADQLLLTLNEACPNLVRLDISSSDVTQEGGKAVSNFSKLTRFIVRETKITSDFFRGRRFSNKLTHIDLRNTNVDSKVIAWLPPSVTHLRLVGTEVTAEAIPDLVKRKNLKYLTIPERHFSHSEINQLKEGLPNTKVNSDGVFSAGF